MIHVLFAFMFLVSSASAATVGITRDMIMVALSSAHISTTPGAQMKLIDRTSGQWHDFTLRRFDVKARGKHVSIDIDVE